MHLAKSITRSAEETFNAGFLLGKQLKAPAIVAFFGDLGTGKTTLIRGLASAFGVEKREICSPTFTYLNIYQGKAIIYHFDLYRLPSEREFVAAGFDEFLYSEGICCIEWSERIPSLLPKSAHKIAITIKEGFREINQL